VAVKSSRGNNDQKQEEDAEQQQEEQEEYECRYNKFVMFTMPM
jgi:hypothetical protein